MAYGRRAGDPGVGSFCEGLSLGDRAGWASGDDGGRCRLVVAARLAGGNRDGAGRQRGDDLRSAGLGDGAHCLRGVGSDHFRFCGWRRGHASRVGRLGRRGVAGWVGRMRRLALTS